MSVPRILFVGNFLTRHWGAGRTGIDMRLAAGAIRNNWQVITFSERDIARFLAPLGFLRNVGAAMMNARLVKTARNWRPDVVFVSHCDYVTNAALERIREVVPGVRIAHLNCDAPAQAHTQAQLERRKTSCDAIFLTTAGAPLKALATGRNVAGYFPNPSDPSFETEDNSVRTDFAYDVFFAGRARAGDARKTFLDALRVRLAPSVRLGFFGVEPEPSVVGRDYEAAIAAARTGLSLNRYEGEKWYASDRIAHLMGNGVLTYQNAANGMQSFFSDRETVYYTEVGDLAERIAFYQAHDDARRAVAAAGRVRYHRLFAAERVIRYLVAATRGEPFAEPYEWAEEVYR